jgi:large subunit ribosomal protein L4
MKINVVNMQGQKVQSIDLPANIFEAEVNMDLMHQAYTRQMANARLGTSDTKTRSEVSGGGHKPWRQKGTGRARQGSTRAPQWKGGGKVHTPHPRSYAQAMPKQMRRAALRSALSVKAAESGLVVLDQLVLSEAKSKSMTDSLTALVGDASVLILIPEKNPASEIVVRSTRNIPDAKTLNARYLNIRDLLSFDKVIMPLGALDVIKGYLG